jgi:hypothetical protein
MKNYTKAIVLCAAAILPAVLVYSFRSALVRQGETVMAQGDVKIGEVTYEQAGFVRMVDNAPSEANPRAIASSPAKDAPVKAKPARKAVASKAAPTAKAGPDKCQLHELEQGGSPSHPFVLVCTY